MLTAIIVAAGRSRRAGFDKLLAKIAGRSVIQHTLAAFEKATCVNDVLVVSRETVAMRHFIAKTNLRKVRRVVGGGVQRDLTLFGDYSQMTIDPVDDCTFWYTGTYYPATTTPNDWHTRIGAFKFENCHAPNVH